MEVRLLEILGHTLGVNVYHAKNSKLKRDKKLPKEFYRNRFCAGENHDDINTLKELVLLGYMETGFTINQGKDTFYHATDLGTEKFIEEFKKYVI